MDILTSKAIELYRDVGSMEKIRDSLSFLEGEWKDVAERALQLTPDEISIAKSVNRYFNRLFQQRVPFDG